MIVRTASGEEIDGNPVDYRKEEKSRCKQNSQVVDGRGRHEEFFGILLADSRRDSAPPALPLLAY